VVRQRTGWGVSAESELQMKMDRETSGPEDKSRMHTPQQVLSSQCERSHTDKSGSQHCCAVSLCASKGATTGPAWQHTRAAGQSGEKEEQNQGHEVMLREWGQRSGCRSSWHRP
jgi:hypothetical protein